MPAKSPKATKPAIRKAVARKSIPRKTGVKKATAPKKPAATSGAKTAPVKTAHVKAAPAKSKPAAKDKAADVLKANVLKIGQKAPAFRLPGDAGKTLALKDFAGAKLVIFFYPRADTPGCTREAIDFTRLKGDFVKAGASVIGVSADPVQAQSKFRDKHKLGVPLGSDETHAMLEAYGAWGKKSLYGKEYEGIIRSTLLIDAAGKIAQVWRNVKVDGHADAVLAAVKAL